MNEDGLETEDNCDCEGELKPGDISDRHAEDNHRENRHHVV